MDAFLHFVTQDWYFAFPMLGMSVVAITLVIWRLLLNFGAAHQHERLPARISGEAAKGWPGGGAEILPEPAGDDPARWLFTAGLETSKQGLAAMRRAMAGVIELEIVPDLNFLLPTMLAIAKIATMVGLLGTVISMIGTFNQLGAGKSDAAGMATHGRSIGLALFATALGLMTAIPLVFAHVMFKAWIANFEIKMKGAGQKLTLLMQSAKPALTPTPMKSKSDSAIVQKN